MAELAFTPTLKLAVIGAWRHPEKPGRYNCFLMGAEDNKEGKVRSVCRLSTGFSQEEWDICSSEEFWKELTATTTTMNLYDEIKETPDVWFRPLHVWEVRGADFYFPEGGDPKCPKLRFPRFLRIALPTTPVEELMMYHRFQQQSVTTLNIDTLTMTSAPGGVTALNYTSI